MHIQTFVIAAGLFFSFLASSQQVGFDLVQRSPFSSSLTTLSSSVRETTEDSIHRGSGRRFAQNINQLTLNRGSGRLHLAPVSYKQALSAIATSLVA